MTQALQNLTWGKAIEDFAEPLLAEAKSADERQKMILVAMICWNISLSPALKPEIIKAAKDEMGLTEDEINWFSRTIDLMVERHKRMFPRIHRVLS